MSQRTCILLYGKDDKKNILESVNNYLKQGFPMVIISTYMECVSKELYQRAIVICNDSPYLGKYKINEIYCNNSHEKNTKVILIKRAINLAKVYFPNSIFYFQTNVQNRYHNLAKNIDQYYAIKFSIPKIKLYSAIKINDKLIELNSQKKFIEITRWLPKGLVFIKTIHGHKIRMLFKMEIKDIKLTNFHKLYSSICYICKGKQYIKYIRNNTISNYSKPVIGYTALKIIDKRANIIKILTIDGTTIRIELPKDSIKVKLVKSIEKEYDDITIENNDILTSKIFMPDYIDNWILDDTWAFGLKEDIEKYYFTNSKGRFFCQSFTSNFDSGDFIDIKDKYFIFDKSLAY